MEAMEVVVVMAAVEEENNKLSVDLFLLFVDLFILT